jgi:hypothetical protein
MKVGTIVRLSAVITSIGAQLPTVGMRAVGNRRCRLEGRLGGQPSRLDERRTTTGSWLLSIADADPAAESNIEVAQAFAKIEPRSSAPAANPSSP